MLTVDAHVLSPPRHPQRCSILTGDMIAGQQAVLRTTTFPKLTLIHLTKQRANVAAQIVINHRLRRADAVYVAVAQKFGTTLITWDAEMMARCLRLSRR